jgi:arylformamidase
MRAGWATLGQAARDAAYNNNLAVANSAALVERRNAASAAFRAAHPAGLDVPYGPAPRQRFDLFAASSAVAPCLVFIHGGYWQRNTREDFACFAEGVLTHGWSMALPGYTLAPEATLTEIVGEIRRALDWLAADGSKHGVGAGPIVVSGWSAGGHLTAMALDHPRVAAGVAISGVYELAPIRETYLNEKLRLTDAEIAAFSPLRLPASESRSRSPMAPRSSPLSLMTAAISMLTALRQERPGRSSRSRVPTISPFWKSCGGRMESSCAPRSISSAKPERRRTHRHRRACPGDPIAGHGRAL